MCTGIAVYDVVSEDALKEIHLQATRRRNQARREKRLLRAITSTAVQVIYTILIFAGKIRVSELYANVSSTPATTRRCVKALVSQKLLFLTSDAEDKRERIIHLTKAGFDLATTMLAADRD